MPRLVIPPSMTPEVSQAHEILGNRAKTTILRFLATHGAASVTQLAEELETSREAVYVHLRQMLKAGVVTSPSRGKDDPNARHWTLVTNNVKALQRTLIDYIDAR
jgi:DNA-binding transcriptional ArsR family regulator